MAPEKPKFAPVIWKEFSYSGNAGEHLLHLFAKITF
jgi:hypothetical protein